MNTVSRFTLTTALAISAAVFWFTVDRAHGQSQIEEASAEHIPWSGYWWPIAKGELIGPLVKYDKITGGRATPWELQHNPPGSHLPEWHGYCHGWAAASILEREPRSGGPFPRGDRAVEVDVADQKAWLAASHAGDLTQTYGDRFGDGLGSEDVHDIAPDVLWELLRTFIKRSKMALVMDLDPGPEVWNYPVYAYRVEHQPDPRRRGIRVGQLSLWAAEDAVPPDFVGLLPHFQTYTFEFRGDRHGVPIGGAKWTGESLNTHPDFAWYPVVVAAENPELDYSKVKQIIDDLAARTTPTRPAIPGFDPAEEGDPLPVSPEQLVLTLASTKSAFFLDLRMAVLGSGRYTIGDRLSLRLNSERAGYLYLLHVTPRGELSLMFPPPNEVFRIPPDRDTAISIPGDGQPGFRVTGPYGNHLIKAVVSERPLLLTGLVRGPPRGGGDGGAAGSAPRPGDFRLFTTQHRHIKSLLTDYMRNKSIGNDRNQVAQPRLKNFAQDEVTYYVGPKN